MAEGRTHHLVRIDANGARHLDSGNGGGSRSGSGELATLGAGLQPLRLLPGRRAAGQAYADGEPHSGVASPVVAQQVVAEQQQYHPQLKEGMLSAAQRHHHHAQFGQGAQQLVGVDEEAGVAGSGQGNGTLLTPTSPTTLRRNGRLALLSMLLLVFQGTALSIMLRYSRAREGQPYLASVSVIFTEVIKLLICLTMQFRVVSADVAAAGPAGGKTNGGGGGGSGASSQQAALWRELRRQARDITAQSLPMLLPAAMFVMQQVLLIVAATHLDAVAFQIFSQSFKLVPTALFAYWLLGQMLEPMQWASIPVLAVGVVLVTVNNGSHSAHQSAAAAAVSSSSSGLDYVTGMVACSVSGLSSAYAGVYFEKFVKGRHAASLWVRNIQLGMFGVPLSTAYALLKDGWRIRQGGVMQGFDAATWMVVALQVFGGLVTGMVVKYCDNILKNFALAISVILTVLVAIPLFGQWPSPVFLLGVALVLLSVFMYGRALDVRKLHLCWQRTLKRLLPQDPAARSRRLLALLLLATAAAGFVLIATGISSSRHLGTGLPLVRRGGGGGANRRLGRRGGKVSETELALQMAAVDRSDAGRRKKAGLRKQVGQLLKDSVAQQQLIADGGKRRRRHQRHTS